MTSVTLRAALIQSFIVVRVSVRFACPDGTPEAEGWCCCMVTVGSKADLGNDTVSPHTLSANRKIHSWAPRTGRSSAFNLWVNQLQYVLDEFDYSSLREFMHDEPPNLESAKAMDKASGTNTGEKVYPQALQDFQTINTAVFNFVKDTLILEGEFLLDDMATIRSYASGKLPGPPQMVLHLY